MSKQKVMETELTPKEIDKIVFCIKKQISQMEKTAIYAKIKGIRHDGFEQEIFNLNQIIEKITHQLTQNKK